MATTVYKPVHETTETANYGKYTGTIKGSYLMHVDENTKVFMNKLEKLGLYIKVSYNCLSMGIITFGSKNFSNLLFFLH